MAFHRYLGVTFIYTVAFHRLALDRLGNIPGGIIGIHLKNYLSQTKKAVVFFDIQSTSPMNFEN